MTEYWLVVAMIAIAVASVAVVVINDISEPQQHKHINGDVVWVAIGQGGGGSPESDSQSSTWVSDVASALSERVRSIDLTDGQLTLGQTERDVLPVVLNERPDVVSVWLSFSDLIAGTPVPVFEQQLASLLTRLSGIPSRVLIGLLPERGQASEFAESADDPMLVWRTIRHWNASITRVSIAHGARVVDLSDQDATRSDWAVDRPGGQITIPSDRRESSADIWQRAIVSVVDELTKPTALR